MEATKVQSQSTCLFRVVEKNIVFSFSGMIFHCDIWSGELFTELKNLHQLWRIEDQIMRTTKKYFLRHTVPSALRSFLWGWGDEGSRGRGYAKLFEIFWGTKM